MIQFNFLKDNYDHFKILLRGIRTEARRSVRWYLYLMQEKWR